MRGLGVLAASALMVATYMLSWIIPIIVSLMYQEYDVTMLLLPGFVSFFIISVLCYQLCHRSMDCLRPRDGFLIVGLVWVLVSLISSVPYYMVLNASLADSVFEAVSGVTTTGIEAIKKLELWPRSMLWYRQQLEFIGGVGIIIMTMSLMSFHEGAVLSIYHGEYGRDIRDFRVTPRLKYTAHYVCGIYSFFFILCAILHWFSGVPLFFAMLESMATVSTGGFSISSLYPIYQSYWNQFVAILFMTLGAIGFHVHYAVFSGRFKFWSEVGEVKFMLGIITLVSAYCIGLSGIEQATQVIFDVVAFVTTTGFETTIQSKSDFLTMLFWTIGMFGACAGSTAGGVKLVRVSILYQDVKIYLQSILYPNSISHITVDGRVPRESYIQGVRGFIGLFIMTFVFAVMMLVYFGLPMNQSFIWVSATLTNLGATVGPVSMDALTTMQKALISVIMIIGRVEIASLLVLCLPRYWR